MAEVEDVLAAADLRELEDVTDRVMTEEYLTGRRAWPIPTIMPLKRWEDAPAVLEVGYVRRAAGAGRSGLTVFTDDGPVRSRTYTSLDQLLDAGWRCD